MVELWAYGICQTQILTGTKFILLVYRLMTLWTQDIRTLNDRRGRKISDLTNSACTWSRYIPCLVLLILLWNSFFWPSRASGSRKCTGWYHFGFVSNINTLPIDTSDTSTNTLEILSLVVANPVFQFESFRDKSSFVLGFLWVGYILVSENPFAR